MLSPSATRTHTPMVTADAAICTGLGALAVVTRVAMLNYPRQCVFDEVASRMPIPAVLTSPRRSVAC